MGLDTTHEAWHGPYSSFNQFRYWLANLIGISLNDYIGYNENGTKDLTSINHPLMPLFNHSDCDGKLTSDECKQIAEGIDSALKNTEPDEQPYSHYQEAITFRDGCLLAYSKNEEIEFH